ncbi:thiamine pyrophosphate-dependent dehydrogenase E1 component subunit alpha [Nocardioides zeae]|uniref:Thiamine pyrophosphate-dependent dehydrogenase E1 component subunit alpha n=1 Tax=Nocardioides imazamoxiresistens TaxID=3231893 RepID=A0ABU3PSR3_9ACTN|nr:thiamine pyrophosphate-dependent dehydrogenase E1 component subunit alpha [Nocardioides zeae]MDT9592280.1 thiamine pyrophosphate-dependent dehydrogenase E1 component subunit alpha [Nocardioides zeae]
MKLDDLLAMWRIRALEEKIRDLRLEGSIVGSVHLSNGQESVAVAACSQLRPVDAVYATYRGHGWAVARGVPPREIFAELLGRVTGVNGGRGGSAHFSAPQHGFHGENSIVGAGAPIAVGAALAGRFDGSGRIALTVFGDGAMNQGAVAEAMNFAAAFSLGVVFVCENNRYSELTPIDDMVAQPDLSRRATALGIPAVRVDGNDLAQVRTATRLAVESAAAGRGPSFVEAHTQRIVGHYIGDAEQYRPAGELERDLELEPIARLTRELLAEGVPTEAVARCEERARAEMDAAADAALADPLTDPATAKDHLYA